MPTAIAVLATACISAPACRRPTIADHPSILLLTVDTLRPDYLSMNGYDRKTSPHLDALIAGGVYFERAVSPIGRTTPALASLLTGAYPHRTGVRRLTDALADDVGSVAEAFRRAGYQTLAVVTNHMLGRERRLDRGFEVYDAAHDARAAPTTSRIALGHLRAVDPERPVLAWIHFIDPHVPYHPTEERVLEFDPDYRGRYRLNFGWQPRPGLPARPYTSFPPDMPKGRATHDNPLDEATNAHIRRLYAGDVRDTDEAIGHLVREFRAIVGEPSIVVVTADHGESLGEHDLYFDHGEYTTEAELRVPLAVIPSDASALSDDRRCETRVSLVDVAPTLLDLAGIHAPDLERQFEGRSLAPCLVGEPLGEVPVFAESGQSFYPSLVPARRRNDVSGRFRSVTLGEWKLVGTPFAPPEDEWALYDLSKDPWETNDLYRRGHPKVAELRPLLVEWVSRARRTEREPAAPSEEDQRRLRQLGYLP